VEKVLQDAGIKLTSVASQTYSKSARAMLDALHRTATIGTPPGRYQPPDSLVAFLEAL
jgi:hypothetical protein